MKNRKKSQKTRISLSTNTCLALLGKSMVRDIGDDNFVYALLCLADEGIRKSTLDESSLELEPGRSGDFLKLHRKQLENDTILVVDNESSMLGDRTTFGILANKKVGVGVLYDANDGEGSAIVCGCFRMVGGVIPWAWIEKRWAKYFKENYTPNNLVIGNWHNYELSEDIMKRTFAAVFAQFPVDLYASFDAFWADCCCSK